MLIHLLNLSDESMGYIERSARIRNISRSRLMERVMKTVCEEQLILSILDDESKQPSYLPGEKTKSHFKLK